MNQIYVSGPWSFSTGVQQIVKYIRTLNIGNVVYNGKSDEYDSSKLYLSDCVVFVLEGFAWQQKLENISKGVLSELLWCINNRVPMFLAYKSNNGLGIYGVEINDKLIFKGVAGTSTNFYTIASCKFNSDILSGLYFDQIGLNEELASMSKDDTYTKVESDNDSLNSSKVEQPKNYFY